MHTDSYAKNRHGQTKRVLFALLGVLVSVLAASGLAHARDVPQMRLYADGAGPVAIILLVVTFALASTLVARMYRKVAAEQNRIRQSAE